MFSTWKLAACRSPTLCCRSKYGHSSSKKTQYDIVHNAKLNASEYTQTKWRHNKFTMTIMALDHKMLVMCWQLMLFCWERRLIRKHSCFILKSGYKWHILFNLMVEGLNYCVNITVIIHLGNTASISGRNVAEKKRLFIFANYTLTSLQNCIAGVCGVIYSRRVTIETVFMLRASMGNTATLLTYVLASYFSHFVICLLQPNDNTFDDKLSQHKQRQKYEDQSPPVLRLSGVSLLKDDFQIKM